MGRFTVTYTATGSAPGTPGSYRDSWLRSTDAATRADFWLEASAFIDWTVPPRTALEER
jgi:propionyl-CoA synthetase